MFVQTPNKKHQLIIPGVFYYSFSRLNIFIVNWFLFTGIFYFRNSISFGFTFTEVILLHDACGCQHFMEFSYTSTPS